ncbi:hypothetical protein AVEN_185312-1 [Araneus ventricosus]|uniref:Uncharacterized protein n=1 Tax=Araneus ventricosus TaxID=182803 RepID=A0A4Y2PZ58_ARAVE|nr:hypothetical protein AVEN_185312-1 [Araneus ventricosus]
MILWHSVRGVFSKFILSGIEVTLSAYHTDTNTFNATTNSTVSPTLIPISTELGLPALVSLEIAKRGKPFADGEYVKDCFIRASEELFRDFKNKAEIMKKIKDLPLFAKTVQDRTAKMSSNVTHMQVEDIQLASAL